MADTEVVGGRKEEVQPKENYSFIELK